MCKLHEEFQFEYFRKKEMLSLFYRQNEKYNNLLLDRGIEILVIQSNKKATKSFQFLYHITQQKFTIDSPII